MDILCYQVLVQKGGEEVIWLIQVQELMSQQMETQIIEILGLAHNLPIFSPLCSSNECDFNGPVNFSGTISCSPREH